jgi:2-dehydro-3-deoxy-D-arabinonate dehydratase
MKLLQFYLPQAGLRVGILRDERVVDITALDHRLDSMLALFNRARQQRRPAAQLLTDLLTGGAPAGYDFAELNIPPDGNRPYLAIPIFAPEVWAFGVTYKRSAEARDEDAGREQGIYERVYNSARPECFFKATPSRCVGPNDYICIRSDSALTAPEPELAYILGENGQILGYTICNDVSAWDIERDNPLYLPQSKIYTGCCALGPLIVTPDELTDPMKLTISCRIVRDNQVVYSDTTNSSRIGRSFEELNRYLCLHNPVPFGTAVSTGTGIMVPNEYHLRAGDVVEIEIEGIGRLVNPVRQL